MTQDQIMAMVRCHRLTELRFYKLIEKTGKLTGVIISEAMA